MAQIAGTPATFAEKREDRPQRDWGLIVSALILFLVGLSAIGTVSYSQDSGSLVWRQIINGALGLAVFLVFNLVPLSFWKKLSPVLYVINLGLLAAVLKLGTGQGGVDRWINIGPIQFQPSELVKVFFALTIASYFAKREEHLKSPLTSIGAILHLLPIAALVFIQPHYAGFVGIMLMGFAAALYAGVPLKHFLVAIAAFTTLVLGLYFTPGLMPEYQKNRIGAYFSAREGTKDLQGAHYQQHQAEIAIGSGGFTGSGFMNGDQVESGTVPVQSTDFIFTAIGEEWGFVGSTLVLLLFATFFYRIWLVTFRAESTMARVTAGALFTVLAFHFVVNMAMVLQYGPVVGMWLPFLSYGGTALWMCFASVALIEQAGRS